MPLFESVEGDLTAFFVSQGSVFDSLVKSFMERLVLIETRVNTLSIDMSSNFQNVHELIHSANMSNAAAIAALALTHEAHEAAPVQQKATPDYNAAVNVNHMGSDELEYYIMTLSRQLHLVLELFFQPYALDAMPKVQSKQAQFQTISDVLTQNEAILMQLSALERSEQRLPPEQERDPVDGQGSHDRDEVRQRIDPILETREKNEGDEEEKYQEAEIAVDASQLDKEEAIPDAEHEMAPPDRSNLDVSEPSAPDTEPTQPLDVDNDEAPENAPEVKVEVEIPPTELYISIKDDPKDQGDIQDTSFENAIILEQERNEVIFPFPKSRRGTKRDSTQRIGSNNRQGTGIATSRQQKQSLYDSFREFHERQGTEEERQRLRDEELLYKMQQMVLSSCRNTRRETISTLSSMWQEQLAELERQQIKLRTEWQQQQQQQVAPEVLERQQQQLQQEIDRQLMAFLSAQQVQEQQITEIWTRIHDFPNQFMRKEDFEEMASAWLQSARDECIFGVSAGALAAFKDELSELQDKLQTLEAPSPEMEQLLAEVQRVLELLTKVLKLLEADGLHGPQGVQMMQTVCTLLTMVDDLSQNMQNDQESDATSTAFISEVLRRMELGTVNLLEAFEAQQDRYQQAFEQQHAAIAQLQRELWEQKEADQELKNQLAGCPSQEDTMRFIQELRDQISMTRSDSAMRMLETVDELRSKMSGLPTADVIEKLRHAIQTKADRAEMDRLKRFAFFLAATYPSSSSSPCSLALYAWWIRSLLAAANSSTNSAAPMAPFGSLMKTPMRCLSCDQTLPYVPTGNPSPPEHHGGPHLPRTCFHHPHPQDPSEQPHYYDDTRTGNGIGFRKLFAPSVTAVRRRKERQHNLPLLGLPQNTWTVNAAVPSRATFVNLDDGRNRIPLRKTLLSDQVIYGPAITPNAFRKREFYRFDGQQTARPKTALPSDRRGEIITRSISSTVVIRPFAEQQQSEELETTRSKR